MSAPIDAWRNAPIDASRLQAEIEELARFSDTPYPSVTRILFTEQDMRARAWLTERMRSAGLAVRVDAVGNILARWEGTEPDLPAVATGSHCDAIPDAGRFDGVIGVLGGLEAIRALQAAGHTPRRAIELIMFTAEEPTRYALGCLGSRVLAGVVRRSGSTPSATPTAAPRQGPRRRGGHRRRPRGDLAPGHYAAFLELHIEQGPELEASGTPIGVVTAHRGPRDAPGGAVGRRGPRGRRADAASPRPARRGASEVVLAVDREARGSGARDTVGTVGLLTVDPGAVNSIPRRVRMDIDIRDTDLSVATRCSTGAGAARDAAACHGVDHEEAILNADDPMTSDPAVLDAIESACAEEGLEGVRMISRAYHDCVFMARLCPAAMVFVPSKNGVSHRPDEYTVTPRDRPGHGDPGGCPPAAERLSTICTPCGKNRGLFTPL